MASTVYETEISAGAVEREERKRKVKMREGGGTACKDAIDLYHAMLKQKILHV